MTPAACYSCDMGKTYYVMDLDMYNPFEWASAKHEMVAASETDAAERHAAATVEEYGDGMRFRVLVATKPDGSDARLHEGRCSITVVFKTSKSSDYELPAPVADGGTT